MDKYCECEHITVSFDDDSPNINVSLEDHSDHIGIELSQFAGTLEVSGGGTSNYEALENLPSINGAILRGNMSAADIKLVLQNTTSEWNSNPLLISEKGTLYVYEDHKTDSEGNSIPGLKIGDGTSYLIDMPFVMDSLDITQADIDFWNSKWRGYIDEDNSENLVFTTL